MGSHATDTFHLAGTEGEPGDGPHDSSITAVERADRQITLRFIRISFWIFGTVLALIQTWSFRHWASADAIAYLDMSDAVFPGYSWHRLITGVWSPLYPLLLGAERLLHPDAYYELTTSHILNIPIFFFAFACFEFLLRALRRRRREAVPDGRVYLPEWAYSTLGYTLFLWACIGQITFQTLRPDMLMSAFVYLAVGVLLHIERGGFLWWKFLLLGVILGTAFLAKAPMLPIGLLILAITVFIAADWARAVRQALVALAILMGIGALYYVPLSESRGHLTLGEASTYNYLYHVNRAGPVWYVTNLGSGTGKLLHPPERVYDEPPTFSFRYAEKVTQPLRYDPSYWTEGARPRFHLKDQFWALVTNADVYAKIVVAIGGLIVGFVVLCFLVGTFRQALRDIAGLWPLLVIGLAGLGMYMPVHVENRYVGVFFVIFWIALFFGLRLPKRLSRRAAAGVVVGIGLSVLVPITHMVANDLLKQIRSDDDRETEAAKYLARLGVRSGDLVARISPSVVDLAWARVLRVTVVAEVEFDRAQEFWTANAATQEQVLQTLSKTGARIVVAHVRGNTPPAGWQRLGTTPYWVHELEGADKISLPPASGNRSI